MDTAHLIRESVRTSRPVEVTEAEYIDMRDVLPPVYGYGCWAMGEILDHTPQGTPVYYWFAERDNKFFCFVGTKAEAELVFAN